jgi:hypothetical protein
MSKPKRRQAWIVRGYFNKRDRVVIVVGTLADANRARPRWSGKYVTGAYDVLFSENSDLG